MRSNLPLGRVGQRIEQKLRKALSPHALEVSDESSLHAGHAAARAEGETHFRVRIVARLFEGKSLLERHRMINEVLAEELAGPVHALAITALSEQEAAKGG
ncbi:MAG TPA: BolA family protein [Aestuariivirgaceae bacterium]|jgi:BolA protein